MERLTISVHQGPSSTIARVSHAGFTATGEAKRCPADTDDPEIGTAISVGRALQVLGEDLEHFGITRSHTRHHP